MGAAGGEGRNQEERGNRHRKNISRVGKHNEVNKNGKVLERKKVNPGFFLQKRAPKIAESSECRVHAQILNQGKR